MSRCLGKTGTLAFSLIAVAYILSNRHEHIQESNPTQTQEAVWTWG